MISRYRGEPILRPRASLYRIRILILRGRAKRLSRTHLKSHSFSKMVNLVEVASRYTLPAAAATVGAMYMDAKHHIVKDINAWRAKRRFPRVVAEVLNL